MESKEKKHSYTYIRYQRDGSVKEITAVVRSRSEGKKSQLKKKGVNN